MQGLASLPTTVVTSTLVDTMVAVSGIGQAWMKLLELLRNVEKTASPKFMKKTEAQRAKARESFTRLQLLAQEGLRGRAERIFQFGALASHFGDVCARPTCEAAQGALLQVCGAASAHTFLPARLAIDKFFEVGQQETLLAQAQWLRALFETCQASVKGLCNLFLGSSLGAAQQFMAEHRPFVHNLWPREAKVAEHARAFKDLLQVREKLSARLISNCLVECTQLLKFGMAQNLADCSTNLSDKDVLSAVDMVDCTSSRLLLDICHSIGNLEIAVLRYLFPSGPFGSLWFPLAPF